MVSTTNQPLETVHRSELSPLVRGNVSPPLESVTGWSHEIAEHTHGQQTLYQQNLVSLGADAILPEIYDAKDGTITILEGEGSLTLNEETIPLEPGQLVFIPAHLPHRIQTQTRLTFLLSRCEPTPNTHDSAWLITL